MTTEAEIEPKYLSLSKTATQFGVSAESVWRWGVKGLKVGGRTVKLRVVKIGTQLRTTQEWIDAFIADCNPDAEHAAVPAPTGRVPTPNDADEDAREARLRDRLGF